MRIIKWMLCSKAEHEHVLRKRQYAHTFHHKNIICTCRALWKLPKAHRDAILMHEVGHLLAGKRASEATANRIIEEMAGCKIKYIDSPYGEDLEILK